MFVSLRMTKDEAHVEEVMKTVDSFINPFKYDGSNLVSLISGVVATPKAQNDLLNAVTTGEKAFSDFVDNRITSDSVEFFSPIKATRLSTFHQVQKKKSAQLAKAEMQSSDRSLFARLLVVSRSREIDLEQILSYPLSSISTPLATADGSMAKTPKSLLLEAIEHDCGSLIQPEDIQSSAAIIIDAMALIQALPVSAIPATFGMLAESLLTQLLTRSRKYHSTRVDFVIDNYYALTIKGAEREKRGDKHQGRQLQITNGDVKVPNKWKAYLSSGPNKRALLEFLVTQWQQSRVSTDLLLYATTEKGCLRLQFAPDQLPAVDDVPELTCDHEEADTRLILHAAHASESCTTVLIESPDTDVAILALGHAKNINSEVLAFMTGTKDRRRIIDIKAVALKLGDDITQSLIGLHAFSGCDFVSSFSGKGKKTHYQLLKKSGDCRTAMKMLGQTFSTSDTLLKHCQIYTCLLYGDSGADVNKLRFKLFVSKSGSSQAMPPCKDALEQHVKRANYVAAVWRSASTQEIKAPSPTENGWTLTDEQYAFKWHSGNVAPPDVLKTVYCACRKSKCQDGRCSCSSSKLPCTELCQCVDCSNEGEYTSLESSDDESDVDE